MYNGNMCILLLVKFPHKEAPKKALLCEDCSHLIYYILDIHLAISVVCRRGRRVVALIAWATTFWLEIFNSV